MKSIEEIIAAALRIPREQVSPKLSFNAVPEWDSMGHINLMMALEQHFNTTLDEAQMVELTSVQAICDFFAAKALPAA